MTKKSKRYRHSESTLANNRKQWRLLAKWKEAICELDDYDLGNAKGRSRTEHENKLILCSLRMLLRTYLSFVEGKKMKIEEVSWTRLYTEIAENLHVRRQHVIQLHQQLTEDGDLLLFGQGEDSKRGPKEDVHRCLVPSQVQAIVDRVDDYHRDGRTITNREIKNYLKLVHEVTISKATISRYFHRIGLTYKRISNTKRRVGEYRQDLLRSFLIDLDAIVKKMKENNCNIVPVATDESYIHRHHQSSYSYMKKEENQINRSNNKGERLIIMHAISPYGPLCEREELSNVPVSDLIWKGDTCHPHPREDGKITCETIWKSSLRKGNYHDNMNSEMFMKWVVDKLLPTFQQLYGDNKKMILIMDNAPYHHKREIGTLSNKTKKELCEMCTKYSIQYIDVQWNNHRLEAYATNNFDEEMVRFRGDEIELTFDADDFIMRPTINQPFVPSVQELRVGIVGYLKIISPSSWSVWSRRPYELQGMKYFGRRRIPQIFSQ
jgi:transposase